MMDTSPFDTVVLVIGLETAGINSSNDNSSSSKSSLSYEHSPWIS